MARRGKYAPLQVFLNGRLTGRLHKKSSGAIDFRYDPSWLAWENSMPVSLSLPLREDAHIGAAVTAVFENLLPDSLPIRNRIAERVHAEGTDAYSLLSVVGRDCVGALQFLPEDEDPGPVGGIRGEKVDDHGIAAILENLAASPLGIGEDADFRISIAGAQEKTALLFWNDEWLKPSGTTATTHILKPQIGRLPNGIDLSCSVENEYFCLKMLSLSGIPSANAEIRDFAGKKVLVVERFDRLVTSDKRLLRVPQEDCCQALSVPPQLKYQSQGGPGVLDILNLLKGSDESGKDQMNFFISQILFWLIGATDGHAKNFSVRLAKGGRFRMTPLYDVLSAQPSVDSGQIRRNKMKLAMSVGDRNRYIIDSILPRHFYQIAAKGGIGKNLIRGIFEQINDHGLGIVEKTKENLPHAFPEFIAESISNGFISRLKQLNDLDDNS